jgi:hypothetical protein
MTDKWGRRLFKAGAMALLVLGLVHSLSLIRDLVPANDTEKQLLGLMSSYRFNLMGSLRSMDDLFRGFSVSFMMAALGFGAFDVVLWGERAGLLRRAALVNILWLAVMTAVALRYFFVVPTSFLSATLFIFILAWLKLPPERVT